MRTLFIASALGAIALPSALQAAEPSGCVDLKRVGSGFAITGVLTTRPFAGPPNYESIAGGDAPEKALILELPKPMCADDGEFIDGATRFDRVHVSSSDPALLDLLDAAVGRRITVRGEAFGAHTAHHRAPLVLLASQVTVR